MKQEEKIQKKAEDEKLRKAFLAVFRTGKTIEEVAKEYNYPLHRILKILQRNKREYEEAKTEFRIAKINKNYPGFIKISNELGRIPSQEEFNEKRGDIPNFYSIYKVRAIKEGYTFLNPNSSTHIALAKKDMLGHLRELAQKLKRVPTITDIDKDGKYKSLYYNQCFGSVVKARKLAGLTIENHSSKNEPEVVVKDEKKQIFIKELQKMYNLFNRKPTIKELEINSKYTYSEYYRALGTISFSEIGLKEQELIWFENFKKENPNWFLKPKKNL